MDIKILCDFEDLTGLFPRRIEVGANFELWLYPHINLSNGENDFDDLVLIIKNTEMNYKLYIFSENESNFDDQKHLEKIINLIHDVSENFECIFKKVEDIYSKEVDILIEEIKEGHNV